jgi:hypothetical protein
MWKGIAGIEKFTIPHHLHDMAMMKFYNAYKIYAALQCNIALTYDTL